MTYSVAVISRRPLLRVGICGLLNQGVFLTQNGVTAVGRESDILILDADTYTEDELRDEVRAYQEANPKGKVAFLANLYPSIWAKIRSGIIPTAQGCLSKMASVQELNDMCTAILSGREWLDPRLFSHAISSPLNNLTRREAEICHLICQGLGNKQIGSCLGISGKTVVNHVSHIFDKLNVRSRTAIPALWAQ